MMKCGVDGKVLSPKGAIDQYLSENTSEKSYKCNICGRCFISRYEWECHTLQIHMDVKDKDCRICGKSIENFSLHMSLHFGKIGKWDCEICNKTFLTIPSLKKHLHLHKKNSTYTLTTKEYHAQAIPASSVPSQLQKYNHLDDCNSCTEQKTSVKPMMPHDVPYIFETDRETHKEIHHEEPSSGTLSNSFVVGSKPKANQSSPQKVEGELFHLKTTKNNDVPDAIPKYFCEICNASFIFYDSLENHLLEHRSKGKNVRMPLSYPESTFTTGKVQSHKYSKRPLSRPKEESRSRKKVKITQKFPCKTCSACFINEDTLASHNLTHIEDNVQLQLESQIGGHSFVTETGLTKRALSHSFDNRDPEQVAPGEFVCELCACSFTDHKSLLNHMSVHLDDSLIEKTPPEMISCEMCGDSYSNKDLLAKHMLVHLDKVAMDEKPVALQKFNCEVCGDSFTQVDSLSNHMLNHFQDAKVEEPSSTTKTSCSSSYMSHQTFKTRILTHKNPIAVRGSPKSSEFVCEICLDIFLDQESLATHVLTHIGKRSAEIVSLPQITRVNDCILDQETKDSSNHSRNRAGKQKNSSAKNVVPYSGYDGSVKNVSVGKNDNYTMAVSKSLPLLTCSVRLHDITSPILLENSQNHNKTLKSVQNSASKYSCEICFESFSRQITLQRHVSTHKKQNKIISLPEKPLFTCEICADTFSEQQHLMDHMLTHLGINHPEIVKSPKMLVCEICGDSFGSKDFLTDHMFMHFEEN